MEAGDGGDGGTDADRCGLSRRRQPSASAREPRSSTSATASGTTRTYTEVAAIVQEIALGLIGLGLEPGERICILCSTREDWTYCDLAATSAGLVVVPIYPTNSPDECNWVMADSEAVAIIAENEEQLAKVAEIRDGLPQLREIVVIDPSATAAASSEYGRWTRCATLGANVDAGGARDRGETPCGPRTPSRSSTRLAPREIRRAACSRTATTRP